MIDLETTTNCFFQYDSNLWDASSIKTGQNMSTTCNGTFLLGGYGVLGTNSGNQTAAYFQRTYKTIAPHTMLYFSYTLWAVDSWNVGADYFIYQFDNRSIVGWTTSDYQTNHPYQLCGDTSFNDLPNLRIFGRLNHIASSLIFRMISMFNQDPTNESFGIRDLNILFAISPTNATEAVCALGSTSAIPTGTQCICPEGKYYSGGSCTTCHTDCASCFGPGSNSCYACKAGLGYDGTACITCNSACASCFGPGIDQCGGCKTGYVLFNQTKCILPSECVFPYQLGRCGTWCVPICSADQYLYWNGTCKSTCQSLPLVQGFYPNTIIKLCIYPCKAGEYLYWDGQCKTNCSFPLSFRNESGKMYCDFPCSDTSNFLYWNGTCSSSCPSPFIQSNISNRKTCLLPCKSGEYLYWNGQCNSTCSFPLSSRNESHLLYCDFPCNNTSSFLYWNGTCTSVCNLPLHQSTILNKKICVYPCSAGEHLYWDGSCKKACSFPLSSRNESSKAYCDFPCANTSNFLYWNGTCSSHCPSPLNQATKHSRSFCTLPCDNSLHFYHEDTKQCTTDCSTTSTLEQDTYYICAPESSKPLTLVKLLHHIRYLDVQMPKKLKKITIARAMNILSLRVIPGMFDSLREKFKEAPLEPYFNQKGVSSSFIVNFLDDLILFAILLTAGGIFRTIETIYQRRKWSPAVYALFRRLRILTHWNLLLMLFATNIGDTIFFASLEFRTFQTQALSSLEIISVLVAIIILCLVLVFYLGGLYIVNLAGSTYTKQTVVPVKTAEKEGNFKTPTQPYTFQVLYKGYKDDNFLSQSFLITYTTRLALPMFIVACLPESPVTQVVFFVTLDLTSLTYLIYKRPIRRKLELIDLVLLETILITVDASLFGLLFLDEDQETKRTAIGDIIIAGNYAINLLAIIFLALKIGFGVYNAYLLRKSKSIRQKSAWVKLLFYPLQQGCMGFEEMELLIPNKDTEAAGSDNLTITRDNKLYSERNMTTTEALGTEFSFKRSKRGGRVRKIEDITQQNLGASQTLNETDNGLDTQTNVGIMSSGRTPWMRPINKELGFKGPELQVEDEPDIIQLGNRRNKLIGYLREATRGVVADNSELDKDFDNEQTQIGQLSIQHSPEKGKTLSGGAKDLQLGSVNIRNFVDEGELSPVTGGNAQDQNKRLIYFNNNV